MSAAIQPKWGRFDYEDWRESWVVQAMSWQERGLYFQLLALQFEHGAIPASPKLCARMLGVGVGGEEYAAFEAAFEAVACQFDPVENDPSKLRNARQAQERNKAVAKIRQKIAAGRASGKSRRSNKNERPFNDRSNACSTDDATDAELDVDIDIDIETSKETPNAGASELSTRDVTPNVLVGAWIDLQPMRPAPADIKKQGAVAKRICSRYDDEAIHTACDGMAKLFPHSDGAPWDLFDLERKFPKAVQAAMNGGSRKHAWLDTMFDGIPDEGER